MATFPSVAPALGARKTKQPKTRTLQYGDGYEHRLQFGLGQNPDSWSLVFENITTSEATSINGFLEARAADGQYFYWTAPDKTTAQKWVCEQWSVELPTNAVRTVRAEFREVFDPTVVSA